MSLETPNFSREARPCCKKLYATCHCTISNFVTFKLSVKNDDEHEILVILLVR